MGKLNDGYKELYSKVGWHWFCTLNVNTKNINAVNNSINKWRSSLCMGESIQVACAGVLNYATSPHVHLLMFGESKKTGKSLLDVDTAKWEKEWPNNALIKTVQDDGAVGYIFDKNTPDGKYEFVHEMGIKLLKKAIENGSEATECHSPADYEKRGAECLGRNDFMGAAKCFFKADDLDKSNRSFMINLCFHFQELEDNTII